MKYSKDGTVRFDPATHTYWNGSKRLQGVTSYISEFKNPFDADAIAEKYAKKRGLIKEEVLAAWKKEGELSCEYGTAIHNVFEAYIKTKEIITTGKYDKELIAVNFINDIFKTERLIPVECEMIVYNESLASQIDCIAKNKSGEYFILDWKTNKTISKDGWKKTMLPPYSKYPDANFYHYSLQLSLYKQTCKEYPIKDCLIIHLDNTGYNVIQIENIQPCLAPTIPASEYLKQI